MDEPWKPYVKWQDLENIVKWQAEKVIYCMILFKWNIQNREIHKDRKWIGSFQMQGWERESRTDFKA